MRSIRPQTVTLAILAILFGLGAAYFARQILNSRQPPVVQAPPPAPPPEPSDKLLILQSNLQANTRISEQDVGEVTETLVRMKEKSVPVDKESGRPAPNVLKYRQQAVGRVLKTAKAAGSWLTKDDFFEIGEEFKLPPGMNAVYVRVDDPPASSTSLFQAGCFVDVIFTGENPNDGTKLTRRLASRVRVISSPVSDRTRANLQGAAPAKYYIALAVSPKVANLLHMAHQMNGTISVSLCAVQSEEAMPIDPKAGTGLLPPESDFRVTEWDLLDLSPPATPVPPLPPVRYVVEEIRGKQIGYAIFNEDNVRVEQEDALQSSLPPPPAGTAGPTPARKKADCPTCGKDKKKPGSQGNPAPSNPPSPVPAPQHFRDSAPPGPTTSVTRASLKDAAGPLARLVRVSRLVTMASE
jgi:Flp pilus assembly protein CpaB